MLLPNKYGQHLSVDTSLTETGEIDLPAHAARGPARWLEPLAQATMAIGDIHEDIRVGVDDDLRRMKASRLCGLPSRHDGIHWTIIQWAPPPSRLNPEVRP